VTIELRPLGVRCNLRCKYCYQKPQRSTGKLSRKYDIRTMKQSVDKNGGPFTLFGGEPLLISKKDLEELWAWGYIRWGQNGLQTNGTLIEDEHISMFKKYNVQVGISIDGPGALNDLRSFGSQKNTRKATALIERTIESLCQEQIPPSLIVTIHRVNAIPTVLPRMHEWLRYLNNIGISSVRLHILEIDDPLVRKEYALSNHEYIEAFLSFMELERKLSRVRFDLFSEMRNQLLGNDKKTTCIWNACDPLTTIAVCGIEGFGQESNCGRTNKDGIDFVKGSIWGFERYIALYNTPHECGGCKGCRFFLMCKGNCPGTALDGDWRNRTEYCEVWEALYQIFEQELISQGQSPISKNETLRPNFERILYESWVNGRNTYMWEMLEALQIVSTN
jgi:uncharacterized protein